MKEPKIIVTDNRAQWRKKELHRFMREEAARYMQQIIYMSHKYKIKTNIGIS